ncbi:MAG: hypothetical protein HBSAPP01_04080 [Candidatus Brocadia sapporoensis]|uniref:hypothetical protein n=1 Tax=Candidatus Brocadia sapporoensis TaxID=392547 RepID=UPI0015C435A4|nr:hypothetical protein [Candidatus Brocadia sapporoensis]GJQ22618.1 MAG: hypothetical protein HBSAPP01_04080 [Candidatus Brocadia sapporoensis]
MKTGKTLSALYFHHEFRVHSKLTGVYGGPHARIIKRTKDLSCGSFRMYAGWACSG